MKSRIKWCERGFIREKMYQMLTHAVRMLHTSWQLIKAWCSHTIAHVPRTWHQGGLIFSPRVFAKNRLEIFAHRHNIWQSWPIGIYSRAGYENFLSKICHIRMSIDQCFVFLYACLTMNSGNFEEFIFTEAVQRNVKRTSAITIYIVFIVWHM